MKRQYRRPVKPYRWMSNARREDSEGGFFVQYIYCHEDGYVIITVNKIPTRDKVYHSSEWEFIYNGKKHCMIIERSDLSERSLQLYAARFIRKTLQNG